MSRITPSRLPAALVASGLVAGIFIVSPAQAQARAEWVVSPGGSIQAAVDAAAAGDSVVVEAGTYRESVVIQKDGLTLRGRGMVTVEPPAAPSGACSSPGEAIGICVVPADIDPVTGAYTTRVSGVTVKNIVVRGFTGNGVFGFGTSRLTVDGVMAEGNTGYGIVSFDGKSGLIRRSSATGAGEAGIYVGDAPESHTRVVGNRVWDNGIGVFVRHVHLATVQRNKSWANCIGVFLLDDGQPEGSGDNTVRRNVVTDNNKVCPANEEEGIPETSGGGIVLLGSVRNDISRNTVRGNQGTTIVSGGIVAVTSPFSGVPSTGNAIAGNRLRSNLPADLVQDAASTGNTYTGNVCSTSMPSSLC